MPARRGGKPVNKLIENRRSPGFPKRARADSISAMRFGRKPWLWLLLVLAVVITGVTWLILSSSDTPVVRLPDGREFRLESVTFGKSHRYVYGKPWIKVVGALLSSNIITRLGGFVTAYSDTNETLVYWVECRRPAPSFYITVAAIVDQSGLETARTAPFSRLNLSPTQSVQMFKFTSFPRRAEGFDLVLSESVPSTRGEVARFPLRNPARHRYSTWMAEPLPITRVVEGETFTLTEFNTGLDAEVSPDRSPVIWPEFKLGMSGYASGAGAMDWYSASWSELRFRLGTAQQPSGPCDIVAVELRDATGNIITESGWYGPAGRYRLVTNGRSDFVRRPDFSQLRQEWSRCWGQVSLPGALWPEETWRIRLQFRQKPSLQMPTNRLVHFKSVPIPTSATAGPIARHATDTIGTLSLTLHAGDLRSEQQVYPGWITVNVYGDTLGRKGEWTLVQIVDDQARPQPFAPTGKLIGLSGKNFVLKPSPEAKTLDLTCALLRWYDVEFMAKPRVVHTNIMKSSL